MIEFPLHTARLVLSPLGPRDRDAFVVYRRDPEVARWQSWSPDYSTEQADALLAAQPHAVVSGSGEWLQVGMKTPDGRLVGDVAVHALADQPDTFEVGVTLAREFHGLGFAREAVGAVVDALFQNGAHRVIAQTDARNAASGRVFAALAFRHEARHVDADWFKGEWTTLDVWARLRSDGGTESEHPTFSAAASTDAPATPVIRSADATDIEALREIERRAGRAFAAIGMDAIADDDPPSTDDLAPYVEGRRAWVAVDGEDEPVAYVLVDVVEEHAHIEQVTVDPASARRGLGAKLIDRVEQWARAEGLRGLTLTTFERVPWNAPYYSRLGFRALAPTALTAGLRAVRERETEQGLDRWPRTAMVRSFSPTGIVMRPFLAEDGARTLDIFERAIGITARSRYSEAQVSAWLHGRPDAAHWTADRLAAGTRVAVLEGTVVGFTDLRDDGYIDRLFVDPDNGRRGVGATLLRDVRAVAANRGIATLSTHASLVARPVFERAGFRVSSEEVIEKEGEALRRFFMTAEV
ncbi:GNAT family N-acetyltransferase [Microbacterium sp. 179-I 3D4 NHS]|uniref:GNAT family N-acetyltransferase n=1 Tax=Microbacterium sp. 179-I 3D4 NHS TaxID=3142381 RepID=UPI0039A1E1BC